MHTSTRCLLSSAMLISVTRQCTLLDSIHSADWLTPSYNRVATASTTNRCCVCPFDFVPVVCWVASLSLFRQILYFVWLHVCLLAFFFRVRWRHASGDLKQRASLQHDHWKKTKEPCLIVGVFYCKFIVLLYRCNEIVLVSITIHISDKRYEKI